MKRHIGALLTASRKNIVKEIRCENNGEETKKIAKFVTPHGNRNEEKAHELYTTYDKITFPCTIRSTEKIELVPGSNVYIARNKLEEINRKCNCHSCNYANRKMYILHKRATIH